MWFRPSALTVGAEYELQLVDDASLDLADEVDELLAACADRTHLVAEYFKPTVEIVSRVCSDAAELQRHLMEQLQLLLSAARSIGLRLLGAATHPFSRRQVGVNPDPRSREVLAVSGMACQMQVTYGLHVHVGLRSGEEAIRVMGRLRPYLPVLLALSGNSPYWQGVDSGFASYRQRMLMTLHSFGLPPRLPDWESFVRLYEVSRRAGVFNGLKDIHWDLRPRPDFGTLEIRVMDTQLTVADTATLTGVCHALVAYLRDAAPGELHLRELPAWIEQENIYRAGLHGLNACLIVDTEGGQQPLREMAERVLVDLQPAAQELRAGEYLERALEMARRADMSAQRQRHLLQQSGSLQYVVSKLAAALEGEADRPWPCSMSG